VSPSAPEPPVDLVSGSAEVTRVAAKLHRAAREEVLVFETAFLQSVDRSGAASGLRVRAIFERAALAGPDGAQIVRRCQAVGWEPRIAVALPLWMVIADQDVALLPLDAVATSALVVRTPTVIAAMRALFEHVWSQSITVGEAGGQPDLSESQQRLLELMAAGMKDETIARHLGTSVRTLRRHVTAIEEKVGVDNRVALAVVAVRRGWLH
jgi:DNA-binding CsgD family transcriptional regulator